MKKLRYAFAMEPDVVFKDDLLCNDHLPPSLEKLANAIVERQMETIAIIFLESIVPLNFFGSQLMFATMPFFKLFIDSNDYEEIARFLENRKTVHYLSLRIEKLAKLRCFNLQKNKSRQNNNEK